MIVLSSGLLLATLMGVTHALMPTRPTAVAMSRRVVRAAPATLPVLTKVPARVLIDGRQPSVVVMSGERFEPGLSVTLTSDSFGFTFGANALSGLTPSSFEIDLSAMNDGIYTVYVSNPAGRRSNEMTMVVGHGAARDAVGKAARPVPSAVTTSQSRESRTP